MAMDIKDSVKSRKGKERYFRTEAHRKGLRRIESTRTNTSRLLIYWRV